MLYLYLLKVKKNTIYGIVGIIIILKGFNTGIHRIDICNLSIQTAIFQNCTALKSKLVKPASALVGIVW